MVRVCRWFWPQPGHVCRSYACGPHGWPRVRDQRIYLRVEPIREHVRAGPPSRWRGEHRDRVLYPGRSPGSPRRTVKRNVRAGRDHRHATGERHHHGIEGQIVRHKNRLPGEHLGRSRWRGHETQERFRKHPLLRSGRQGGADGRLYGIHRRHGNGYPTQREGAGTGKRNRRSPARRQNRFPVGVSHIRVDRWGIINEEERKMKTTVSTFRSVLCFLTLLALSVVLAACGSGGGTSSNPSGTASVNVSLAAAPGFPEGTGFTASSAAAEGTEKTVSPVFDK